MSWVLLLKMWIEVCIVGFTVEYNNFASAPKVLYFVYQNETYLTRMHKVLKLL
ncbi:hypothetical protein Lalb_Chr13g0291571 [Lupinus albus]|uniref:Uncharacterized protein n=1 Tax=Lupinus albus TaxID=3870 RepID=A0A6A4PHK9_LUPAL|nr:hypothetical protein Lalb_Chr13g0291571 [Lupinus albus]